MSRIIPLLTLVPSIFLFISIILINAGGVSEFRGGYSSPRESNLISLDLVKWNYTVQPYSSSFYSTTIYLNRQCRGSQSFVSIQGGFTSFEQCPRWYSRELQQSTSTLAPNALISNLRPFRFDTVNLNIPFGFYVVAVIFAFLTMLTGLGATISGKNNRGPKLLGMILSLVTFICILVASAVLTFQSIRLRNQVRDNTLEQIVRQNRTLGSTLGATVTYTIDIIDVSIGSEVQGLTWASVLAALIATGLWVFAFFSEKKNITPPPVYKEARHSTSTSDRYIQGVI